LSQHVVTRFGEKVAAVTTVLLISLSCGWCSLCDQYAMTLTQLVRELVMIRDRFITNLPDWWV